MCGGNLMDNSITRGHLKADFNFRYVHIFTSDISLLVLIGG